MRTGVANSAIRYLAHPLASFHPRRMPLLTRRNYRLELLAAVCFAAPLAAVDGAALGVVAKNAFDGVVGDRALNYAVGAIGAAGEFANLTSLVWARASHGRRKIPFLAGLQGAVLLMVTLMALAPRSGSGLLGLVVCMVAARVCISGIVTLRATVWRSNYPRTDRARITGKMSILQSLVIAAMGAIIGAAMDADAESFRVLFPAWAVVGVAGVLVYLRIRVRHEGLLLSAEREAATRERPSMSPASIWRTLRADRDYAWFMAWLFVIGMGNLMLTAPLVITLRERFHVGYLGGVLMTQTVVLAVMPVFVPLWARLLDRAHVVRFRAVHSWVFVVAQGLVFAGAALASLWLMYAGMVFMGVGAAGAVLAWNLGHLDFAPAAESSRYMAAHVWLNGVRGVIAPLIAVSLYEALDVSGRGHLVFGFSVVLCVAGSLGFWSLSRRMGPRATVGGARPAGRASATALSTSEPRA